MKLPARASRFFESQPRRFQKEDSVGSLVSANKYFIFKGRGKLLSGIGPHTLNGAVQMAKNMEKRIEYQDASSGTDPHTFGMGHRVQRSLTNQFVRRCNISPFPIISIAPRA